MRQNTGSNLHDPVQVSAPVGQGAQGVETIHVELVHDGAFGPAGVGAREATASQARLA